MGKTSIISWLGYVSLNKLIKKNNKLWTLPKLSFSPGNSLGSPTFAQNFKVSNKKVFIIQKFLCRSCFLNLLFAFLACLAPALFFFNFLFFIGVQLTNNAVLVSGIPEVIVFYLFSGKEN